MNKTKYISIESDKYTTFLTVLGISKTMISYLKHAEQLAVVVLKPFSDSSKTFQKLGKKIPYSIGI
mgnify:CR=1 FL=1